MNEYDACPISEDCIIDNCNGLYRVEDRKVIALFSNGEHECSSINVISPEEAKIKELEGMVK